MPDPVGSENSRLTFGLRRTLNAFNGSPMLVVTRKRPSESSNEPTGTVCGAPLRDTVANSQVRYSRIIRTKSVPIGAATFCIKLYLHQTFYVPERFSLTSRASCSRFWMLSL